MGYLPSDIECRPLS